MSGLSGASYTNAVLRVLYSAETFSAVACLAATGRCILSCMFPDFLKSNPVDLLNYSTLIKLCFSHNSENLSLVLHTSLPSRLLMRLFDTPNLLFAVNDIIFNLLATLLQPPTDDVYLLK